MKIISVYIPWEVEKDTDKLFALLILVTFFIVKCNTAVLRDIFQVIMNYPRYVCSR